MSTYTVTVQWLELGGQDYTLGRATMRSIKATSINDACIKAMAAHKDKMCLSVSQAWLDWAAPKERS